MVSLLMFQIVSNKTGLVYTIRTLGILAPDETEIKAIYPGQVLKSIFYENFFARTYFGF